MHFESGAFGGCACGLRVVSLGGVVRAEAESLAGRAGLRAVPLGGWCRADVMGCEGSTVAARQEVDGGPEVCAFVGEQ